MVTLQYSGGDMIPDPGLISRAARIVSAGWPIGPRPFTCVCGAPIHQHIGPAGAGPDGCPSFAQDPAEVLAYAAVDADGRLAMDDVADHNTAVRGERDAGRWQVSPSDVGACRRQVSYRVNPPDGYAPLPEDTRKADAGTAFHAGVTEARAALYPWRLHRLLVPIPGLDREGEADEYDPVTAVVEDWKTAGKATWDWVGMHGPRENAWKQARIYAYGLASTGREVRWVRIRYIHRETGQEETFTEAYDEKAALAALGELAGLLTMLDAGIVPPRDGRGPNVDPLCDRCPARAHCWNIDAAEAAGRTPQTYTAFGANPDADDPAVQWAVAQAGNARLERLAAEKDEDACKALADVDAGTYGDWVVKRGSQKRGQYKEALEALLTAIEEWEATPPDERPPLRSLIKPVPVKVSGKLEIVPVRKAAKAQPVPVTPVGVA